MGGGHYLLHASQRGAKIRRGYFRRPRPCDKVEDMDSVPETTKFPPFLESPDGLAAHLYELFDGEANDFKGDAFLNFSLKFVPLCSCWQTFSAPTPAKNKTHDGGVDFYAFNDDSSQLFCGQSKFRIRSVAEFDEIISKFQSYEKKARLSDNSAQLSLATEDISSTSLPTDAGHPPKKPKKKKKKEREPLIPPSTTLRFIVVTPSLLKRIIREYRQSKLASVPYFEKLESSSRIEVIDRNSLYTELRSLYRENYIISPEVRLALASEYIAWQNVYLSVVTGKTLAELYKRHGSSLFFENIREFLGIPQGEQDGESVNRDILKTLTEEPDMMLARNNGITIRAGSVETTKNEPALVLKECSIVNGCQTTMCIVTAGEAAYDARIVVKIVVGADFWDITKSANNQNRIKRIDLEMARFLRPQLVRKIATDMGFGLPPSNETRTVSNVLESIYRDRVSYEAIRVLYLGLFSRGPNNMWASNYSEMRMEVLEQFFSDGKDDLLLRVCFKLLATMRTSVPTIGKRFEKERFAELFKRFFDDSKQQYQCLLAILAACGCVNDSLMQRDPDARKEFERLCEFLRKLEAVLEKAPKAFEAVLMRSFIAVGGRLLDTGDSKGALAQRMYRETQALAKGDSFERLFDKLRMDLVAQDELLAQLEDAYSNTPA